MSPVELMRRMKLRRFMMIAEAVDTGEWVRYILLNVEFANEFSNPHA
jgi:uncharacterized membrane protein